MTLVQLRAAHSPACSRVPEVCHGLPAYSEDSSDDERTIPRLREPLIGVSFTVRGRFSGPVESAATVKDVWSGAPRPCLPLERSPPRSTSSFSTLPDIGLSPPRHAITEYDLTRDLAVGGSRSHPQASLAWQAYRQGSCWP